MTLQEVFLSIFAEMSLFTKHNQSDEDRSTENDVRRSPSPLVSIVPFAVLVTLLFFVIRFFGSSALDGASQVSLVIAAAVAVAIGMLCYKRPWEDFEKAIMENMRSISTGIIILLLIGAISGTWIVSGIVPTLIVYGLKCLSPSVFLLACCLICALISIMTGSSWTTIATIGVALTGIGMALGFQPGWTAGAIISGAYFGDKISPLSDTTVLASSTTSTPLFVHIKYMMVTTIPSFTIACVIFLTASLLHTSDAAVQTEGFTAALKSSYNISPWLLIVPVFTGILIARKVPALITLTLSAIAAGIAALIAQPGIIAEIGGDGADAFRSGFKGLCTIFYGETAITTGNPDLDELVRTGGMCGMLPTIFLIICAAAFGGTLTGGGMIQSLTGALTSRLRRRTPIVGSTVATGIFCNMVTGDQYLSIILGSSLYKALYKEKGLESRLLSRTLEDSTTVTSVLIPWNSCGMTQSTVLKIPTLEYLPYCFFNLISPLMSIFIAAIGYKIYSAASSSKDTPADSLESIGPA